MVGRSHSVSCRRRMLPTPFSTAWRPCFVNVEELFRRYLEQRREMGESELVLDTLTVEEVLRIGGAHGKRAAAPTQQSGRTGDCRHALRVADERLAVLVVPIPRDDAAPPADLLRPVPA